MGKSREQYLLAEVGQGFFWEIFGGEVFLGGGARGLVDYFMVFYNIVMGRQMGPGVGTSRRRDGRISMCAKMSPVNC